ARSVEHYQLGALDFIENARLKAETALQRPLGKDAGVERVKSRREACDHLAALVFPNEVCARLEKVSRLTIVGRDLFGELPFEALPLPDGQTLGTAKATTNLPSLAVGLALAERARHEKRAPARSIERAVVLVGDPSTCQLGLKTGELESMLGAYSRSSC